MRGYWCCKPVEQPPMRCKPGFWFSMVDAGANNPGLTCHKVTLTISATQDQDGWCCERVEIEEPCAEFRKHSPFDMTNGKDVVCEKSPVNGFCCSRHKGCRADEDLFFLVD